MQKHDDINKNTYIHVYTRIYMYIREEKHLDKRPFTEILQNEWGIRNVKSQL